MSHVQLVQEATTNPVSNANATTNLVNLDLFDNLSCRLEILEDVVEELRLELKSTITCRVCYKNAPVEGFSHVNGLNWVVAMHFVAFVQ